MLTFQTIRYEKQTFFNYGALSYNFLFRNYSTIDFSG